MTHRGPFQPLPFCDSVVLEWNLPNLCVIQLFNLVYNSPWEFRQ